MTRLDWEQLQRSQLWVQMQLKLKYGDNGPLRGTGKWSFAL